jgi:hypothetical protein
VALPPITRVVTWEVPAGLLFWPFLPALVCARRSSRDESARAPRRGLCVIHDSDFWMQLASKPLTMIKAGGGGDEKPLREQAVCESTVIECTPRYSPTPTAVWYGLTQGRRQMEC